jgi:glucose uptake protein GlcU
MGFKQEKNRPKVKPWIIILIFIIGTIGYVGYFLLGQLPTSPYVFNIDPQTLFTNSGGSVETKDVAATLYGFDQFFPQASGMFLFASLFSIYIWLEPMFKKHPMTNLLSGDEKLLEPKIQRYGKISFKEANKFCPWKQSQSYYNMIDGIVFSAAALTILLSKAHNGSAIATTLSQTNIIIATLGGLLILHEKQQKKDLITTLLGMGLVVCGGVIIGLMPQMFLGLPG